MIRQAIINNCFLRIDNADVEPRILNFTNVPDNIGTSKDSRIHENIIYGRAEPIRTWGGSEGRSWTLNLDFMATANVEEEVLKKMYWCEALSYPIYKNGISLGIPVVQFKFGDYLNLLCVCNDVSVVMDGPWELFYLPVGSARPEDFYKPPSDGSPNRSISIANAYRFITTQPTFQKNIEIASRPRGPMRAQVTINLEPLGDAHYTHREVREGKHNKGYAFRSKG